VIRHLRKLVKERSSSGEMTDLNELIAEIVPLAEVDARMHESTIQLNLADALPVVLVDPIQIQQVLLNLVRNGMEAMEHSEADAKIVTIGTRAEDGGAVEISVHDRGIGISSDAEQGLFRTFFTTKRSGMGMGLAISRSIVNSHGGSLWFTRNPDRGVTFYVSLPVAGGGNDNEG
jgi:C4-dicarboxylate-specific signal transduction histidine kinase